MNGRVRQPGSVPPARPAPGVCALFACADPYRVGATSQALAEYFPRVETAGNGRDLRELALELRPDLVVLDRLLPGSDVVETVTRLRSELPDVLVVVLTDRELFEEGLRFFRAGAGAYLSCHEEPSLLVGQIAPLMRDHRARSARRGRARGPHHPGIWAFCGASDGDGRSSLLLSSAYELARHGERVAVLDLDLLFGDLSFFLGLPRVQPDLASLLAEDLFLEPRVIAQHVRVHRSGLHLFPAPFSTADAAAIDAGRIHQLVEALPRHYDHVLLDLPSGFPAELAPVLRLADLVLIVSGATVRGLKDLLVLERLMAAHGIRGPRVRGLLTRLEDTAEIEPILERNPWIEFGLPPRQHSLKSSIEAGEPFPSQEPLDPYCIAVRRLVTLEIPEALAQPARGRAS